MVKLFAKLISLSLFVKNSSIINGTRQVYNAQKFQFKQ